jgi:leucyl-tRNA synthetase
MADKYNPQEVEKKWQQKWADDDLYKVNDNDSRPKWYALTMFPYTSGDLHIGHWKNFAPADVHARYMVMRGYNVLHPQGFDAFGLPAENAAIRHGIHPFKWTMDNIDNMRRQMKRMGAIYDWDREVITCVPEYYKWTQWFFLKLYEHDLAYHGVAPVNWCPKCQVVLANEQVENGKCWRCETDVIKRDLAQWLIRITRYADELLEMDNLDWPERIKTMQTNWIGKSYGTEISFALDTPGVAEKEIRIFTTRPDTVYGVTFMALAPEHPLVAKLTAPEKKAEVDAYVKQTRLLTEIERLSTDKEKDGVFIGAYCINRLNGAKVPIFIADYVLGSYGTGAVMAVPAHDERDFAFAKKYNIPIPVVISPPDWDGRPLAAAYTEVGKMVNSAQFNGLSSDKGIVEVSKYLEEKGWGKRTISYRIRDWLISRQRYWGAPIPMIHCPKCGIVPVPEKDLPVLLPENAEFRPTGESPLKYNEEFVNTTCPKCGGKAKRETDTLDGFLCSCWYALRYTSPHEDKRPFDPARVKRWMPVDFYSGGAEHAVMHLLYTRFFTKAIRDMGIIDFGEPFLRLFNQGTVLSEHTKMSKSKGNVVNPDDYVNTIGADSVRAYIMFIAPWELGGDWDDSGIAGISRWLNRVWNLAEEPYTSRGNDGDNDLMRLTHQTIKKVTEDLEKIHLNTQVAALMEFANYLGKAKDAGNVSAKAWKDAIKAQLLLLAPTAPHMTEELWERAGYQYSIHQQPWPKYDESLVTSDEFTMVVQVNGKVRDRFTAPVTVSEEDAKKMAQALEKIKPFTAGKEIIKVIYVPGKLVNIVVKG